jgi:probable HAF family extracellular repeat protein
MEPPNNLVQKVGTALTSDQKGGNMKFRILICSTAIALFSALAIGPRLGAQDQQERREKPRYRVTNLGNPLGGTTSSGNAMNNLGWAMGAANLPGDTTQHAELWLPGLHLDLGTLGGPNSSVIFANRSDRGEIVGIAETGDMDPLGETWSCAGAFFPTITHHICLGFVWQNGVMTALSTLGGNNGVAASVNNLGQVVGWAENAVHDPTCVSPQVLQFEAVIWGPEKDQIQQLPPLPGDFDTAATAINDKGQVVGISGTCDVAVGAFSAKHAVLWREGRPMDLGSIGGHGWNTPTSINSRGQIVGFANLPGDLTNGKLSINFHAFLWTKERGMRDLGVLPGDAISEALGINEDGQVVGVSFAAGFKSPRAFLWQDDVMTDLNTLIRSGSKLTLTIAGDINDRGEITGTASDSSTGTSPAFLAVPRHEREDDGNEAAPTAEVEGNP